MQNVCYFKYLCYSLCMKNAFKNPRVYIFGGIMSVVGIGLPFLLFGITLLVDNTAPFQYPLLLGLFAAIYLLIGFIWGDMHTVLYRRKTKNWDGELPPESRTESWTRRLPFYLGAITTFLVFIVFDIIYLIIGHYPFL